MLVFAAIWRCTQLTPVTLLLAVVLALAVRVMCTFRGTLERCCSCGFSPISGPEAQERLFQTPLKNQFFWVKLHGEARREIIEKCFVFLRVKIHRGAHPEIIEKRFFCGSVLGSASPVVREETWCWFG